MVSQAAAASTKRLRTEEALPSLFSAINSCVITCDLAAVKAGCKKIGTHDGKFHADEALGVFLLKLLPEWKDAAIVRTRKQEILDACDIVIDVGGTYDHSALRYDHHQKGFEEKMNEIGYSTKLSAAGLVYRHYGRNVVDRIADVAGAQWPQEIAEVVYRKIYSGFMEEIDAVDNGISIADTPLKYRASTGLSHRVGRLYPAWNEPQTDDIVNERFREASLLCGSELTQQIEGLAKAWWPARSMVEAAMGAASTVDPSGQIMVLESGGLPWLSHVFDVEREAAAVGKPRPELLFTLYTDTRGKWRVQAVPAAEGSFESRLKLGASEWRGLRDEELSTACGIPGCIFIHSAGFIGGHETREGALALAKATLALASKSQ